MGHTKEPWIYECGDANYQGIIIGRHGGEVVDGEFSEANARRIVACVNACAGFDTELLELSASGTAPSLREIFTEHSELWKQRDELLAALKIVDERFGPCREEYIFSKRMALDKVKAAIAKAEAA